MCALHELKGRIRAKQLTLEALAPELFITTGTLSKKLNGKADLTLSEIETLCEILEIAPEDVCIYFFPNLVYNMTV